MALDNLSGQRIQESYQKLVQANGDGTEFAKGDGTSISIVTSDRTGSFADLAAISGAFAETSHSLQNRLHSLELNGTTPAGVISASAQIATDISGAFTETSHSLQGRVKTLEDATVTLPDNLISGSSQIATEISGAFTAASKSLASRLTTAESELGNTLISSSAQIKSDISGAFAETSHSLQDRFSSLLKNTTDTLTGDLTVTGKITAEEFHTEFVTSSVIFASGSSRIGNTSDDIHQFSGSIFISGSSLQINGNEVLTQSPFTANSITGSFNAASESINLRINNLTSDYTELTNIPVGIVSGSTQIATEISGAFFKASASFSTRVTTNDVKVGYTDDAVTSVIHAANIISGSAQIATEISGAFVAPSESLSARATSLEGNAVFTSTMISGSFTAPSQSFQSRINTLEGNAVFTSTMISGSFTEPSASFSTRVTGLEDTTSDRTFNNVTASGNISASGNIKTSNINIGTPTANQWQNNLQGSYFNNFDANSNVSEILRFMAGIISHSIDTSSPTPNTKTYGLITDEDELGEATTISGRIPQNFASANKPTINYLNTKGFANIGENIFTGISNVYHDNFSSYNLNFDSNAAGSSTIFSNSTHFDLGPLDGTSANAFKVKVITSQSFSDTGSITTPNATNNKFTSASLQDLSISDFGTSDGLTLTKIQSANPAVIPAAFQDGKFANVGTLRRKYHELLTSDTSVSASGYYRFHDMKVGIATGSGEYQFIDGTTINKFWAPIDQINTDIGTNTISFAHASHVPISCISRSLSGAPYMIDATYQVKLKITGVFNPMYKASSALVSSYDSSTGAGDATVTNGTVSTSGGTIQTANVVYSADGLTARSEDTVPFYDDIIILSASVSYDSGNDTNIAQTGFSDEDFTVTTQVRDRKNSTSGNTSTRTIDYHQAGTFEKSATSGSMAVYGRAQGYDSNFLQDTTETFTGEDNRIVLADNVQEFNGALFTTNAFKTNDAGDAVLAHYDLQVKPGYLVNPTGSYGYWFNSNNLPASPTDCRFYIRKFQVSSPRSQMSIHLSNKSLVNWTSTADNSIACAILFESSGKGSGNTTALSTARIYDPTVSTQTVIQSNVALDNFKNPFATAIDIYGTPGSTKSGANIYNLAINNANGMILDSNDNQFYVIVRYKGDPAPIQQINVSTS